MRISSWALELALVALHRLLGALPGITNASTCSGGAEGKDPQQPAGMHGINIMARFARPLGICMLSTVVRQLALSSLLNLYRFVVASSMLAKVASGYKQAIMDPSTPRGNFW